MKKKRLGTWIGLKRGTRFKVVRNSCGHNYPMNVVLKMSMDGIAGAHMNNVAEGYSCNSLAIADVEFLSTDSIAELNGEIKRLRKEIKDVESKIEFCKANSLEEYDEETHRLFEGIKIVESASTTMDKAVALKKLLG